MKIHQDIGRHAHNVVELPVRLRPDQVERLDAAVARAPVSNTQDVQDHSEDRVQRARERAAEIIATRRMREATFDTVIFADPSWDLLLTLFMHRIDGLPISVSSVCNNVGVPSSTAFRHLSMLVEQGLVTRYHSGTDADIVYAEMERDTVSRMVSLLLGSPSF